MRWTDRVILWMARLMRDDSLVDVIYRDILRNAGITEVDIFHIEKSGFLEEAAMAQRKKGAA